MNDVYSCLTNEHAVIIKCYPKLYNEILRKYFPLEVFMRCFYFSNESLFIYLLAYLKYISVYQWHINFVKLNTSISCVVSVPCPSLVWLHRTNICCCHVSYSNRTVLSVITCLELVCSGD